MEGKTIKGKTIKKDGVEEMPIKPRVQTKPNSYDDFHSLDYEVMGIVYAMSKVAAICNKAKLSQRRGADKSQRKTN
ncbi:MAG: hypothetical protein ACE5IR_08770 [bacterium]